MTRYFLKNIITLIMGFPVFLAGLKGSAPFDIPASSFWSYCIYVHATQIDSVSENML